ncbi:MAG: ethanolamine ammonia-lyase subunit EutC [Pseudomonadota bacterium]
MSDRRLEDLIRQVVLSELGPEPQAPCTSPEPPAAVPLGAPERVALAKRVASWSGLPTPPPPALGTWAPGGARADYLAQTPARLGVGRAGLRYRTGTILAFQAAHAAARDAVASELDEGMLKAHGMLHLQSASQDRREFLVRPDLGRRLSEESAALVEQRCLRGPKVQLAAVDGLSATAINVNLPLVLPRIAEILKAAGVSLGTPCAVSRGRVAAGDHLAHLTEAEVLCLLVGERPGLNTAASMGIYVTYMKVRRFSEAMRFLVSNVHAGGLQPAQGAEQAAALCLQALREKRTGVEV